jgi:hypothetical protein
MPPGGGYKRHGNRIYVPQHSIQGGLGEKFETDPYDVKLHGLMTAHQYTEAIENLNAKLRPSRPTSVDGALLAAGPLMVPLAVWGVRHRNQTKRRKKLLKEGIHEFNMQYQELYMRWNRRPESTLTIERRHSERPSPSQQPMPQMSSSEMAEATLVSDVIAPVSVIPQDGGQAGTAPVHHHQILQQQRQLQQQQQRPASDTAYTDSSGLV